METGLTIREDGVELFNGRTYEELLAQYDGPKTFHLRRDEIKLPRIVMAQDKTKALKTENRGEYIAGLKLGDFYDTLSRVPYGPELDVIVIGFTHTKTQYDKKNLGRKFIKEWDIDEYEREGITLNSDFIAQDGSYYIDNRNFFVALPDLIGEGLKQLTFSGASARPSKALSTMAFRSMPPFVRVFRVGTMPDKQDGADFIRLGSVVEVRKANAREIAMCLDFEKQFRGFAGQLDTVVDEE